MQREWVLAMACGAAVSVGPAGAVDVEWAAPVGGSLIAGGSWSGGMVPSDEDRARLLVPGAFTATLNADATFGALEITGSSPVFQLGGNRLSMAIFGDAPPGVQIGGAAGTSGLLLVSGELEGDQVYIGDSAGATASMTVAQSGTRLLANDRLYVGNAGIGVLDVVAGGRVDCRLAFLGIDPAAQGTVTVTGAGTTWESDLMRVGHGGTGSFSMSGGATALTSRVVVASDGGDGTLSLTGAGTRLTAFEADVTVGEFGGGMLDLSNQAVLAARDLLIGETLGDGDVVVSGAGLNLTRDLIIGRSGLASMFVASGGGGFCRSMRIATGTASLGSMTLSGFFTATQSVDIAPGAFSLGQLNLQGGALTTPTMTIFANGTLSGAGQVSGSVTNAGTVSPNGVLMVDGGFTQTTGTLVVALNDGARVLTVTGTAALGGVLSLSLAPGFEPASMQSFTVLSAGSLTGGFSSVTAPGADWTVETVGGEVVATFTGMVGDPADLDGDGSVGAGDLAILLAGWGACAGCPADLDGDGSVGASDLASLLAAWG